LILEPGDMLYVPPRVAHRGIAVGDDCMTYSVGFRAPSRAELIEGWADDMAAELTDCDRYDDPQLAQQDNPGEISAAAIARLQGMIAETLHDPRRFARWFGQYNTAPKNPEIDWRPDEPATADDIRAWLAAGTPMVRNPASRFSFIREAASSVLLFADGQCFACTDDAAEFAQRVCAQAQLAVAPDVSEATLELIAALFNEGSVGFDFED
jgi:50S ribosomal protein L16 3-hydroxylase